MSTVGEHAKLLQSCAMLWTVACQTPLSMGFSKQEYWSELPCPPPGDLPEPGIKPVSLTSPALAGGFFTTSSWEAHYGPDALYCLELRNDFGLFYQ